MGYFMAAIYDGFMDATEQACLRDWRAQLLAGLEGDVLELGAGTGVNLEHLPRQLGRLVLTEPDRHMRAKLTARVQRLGREAEVSGASAVALPFEDASFDAVVSTLVLCSVPSLEQSLAEVFRVLRPGGRFVFLEHVGAPRGTSRRRIQGLVDPFWRHAAGGCRLIRDTERAILDAGFELDAVERESMRKALAIVRPSIRGVAHRPS
ncbi:MAG: class I SAM-dependent methyltransferase [Deltaproteobacteria bacterium]|nr:class I SAM-dependent methyltransferase [Deltaproteobacteria bacterium]